MSTSEDPPEFTPSPVLFKPSQMRQQSVAVHFLTEDSTKCYEFVHKRTNSNGHSVYTCRGCTSLKKKAVRDPEASPLGPVPTVRIEGDYFIEDPENPPKPHFCEPYQAPDAMMRREQLRVCQSLRNSNGDVRPKDVQQELLNSMEKPEYAHFGDDERLQMIMRNFRGKSNLARQVQRNKKAIDLVPEEIIEDETEDVVEELNVDEK